jgi:hypothetical protein
MDYMVSISANGVSTPGMKLYVTDAQLEEGSLTDFASANPLDSIVTTGQSGNVYYSTDTLTATLRSHNNTSSSITKSLQYEIYDTTNALVSSGSQSVTVGAGLTATTTIPVSTGGKTGLFRMVYWYPNETKTEREIVYSIVPQYATDSIDTASYMGIHPNYLDYQLDALKRLGIKWSRVLSPSQFFRWTTAEPTEGNFVYFDSMLSRGATALMTTMGTLGVNIPAFADSGGVPDLTKWSTYVAAMVSHYKSTVKYWEVWNEPSFDADYYGQMLKLASDAIEANDLDDTTIIGMGGVSASYMTSVISAMNTRYMPGWDWRDHISVLATHNYFGGNPPEGLTTIVDTYSKEVWNTETGFWDLGNYQGVFANFSAPGKAIYPYNDAARFYTSYTSNPNQVIQNFARTLASKQTKYFLYDARTSAGPNITSSNTGIFEYDMSLRAKAIAYGIAGSFLDKSTIYGNVSPNANSYYLLFKQNGSTVPVAVIVSTDNIPRQVTLSGVNHNQLALYDRMGNSIPFTGTTIVYGRAPVYLTGVGISTTTLSTALNGGSISTYTDVTAPNIAIVDGPRGIASDSIVRFRWLGLDEFYLPNLGELTAEASAPVDDPNPSAILYSYKLSPTDSVYSDWVGNTFIDYSDLADGTYTFYVKTKDAAGNESSAVSRTFTYTSYGSLSTSSITTSAPTSVSTSTLTLNANVSALGGSLITERGFAYGTASNLSTVIATTTLGLQSDVGDFSSNITGLTPNTVYYFRAYAVNSTGTSTGAILSTTTLPYTVPSAPTNASASAGDASATITFTASASDGNSTILYYTASSSPGNITATSTGSPMSSQFQGRRSRPSSSGY